MKLTALHRRALSEVDGPLHDALERVLISGASDVGWFRPLPIPEPVYLTVGGRQVWSSETGWHQDSEAIMRHAAGTR